VIASSVPSYRGKVPTSIEGSFSKLKPLFSFQALHQMIDSINEALNVAERNAHMKLLMMHVSIEIHRSMHRKEKNVEI